MFYKNASGLAQRVPVEESGNISDSGIDMAESKYSVVMRALFGSGHRILGSGRKNRAAHQSSRGGLCFIFCRAGAGGVN